MAHNMALLVAPGDYLGTDRDGAIAQIVTEIRNLRPDVVGLCEVFADGEREHIRNELVSLYPSSVEGPDEDDLESDGGLLVLSRHPFLQTHDMIYRDCAGVDCFANKGAIHVRVQPPGSPTAYDIYDSHTQNIEESGGEEALYAQLTKLGQMTNTQSDPAIPTIVLGDLNIPAKVQRHYAQLLTRLDAPVDFWVVAGNSAETGETVLRDSNFYDDGDDRPSHDERLDYILMRRGRRFIPILEKIEIMQFRRNGRFISDHFGLHARIDRLVTIDP